VTELRITRTERLGPFTFPWPDNVEEFEAGWECDVTIDGARHLVRHGIGQREVYGRPRVHVVTWLDREVQVEGVESDDYPTSQAMISRLRRAGRALARTFDEIPPGYEGFEIVRHRAEIDAPYSPTCLAVKLREDDLESWARHAWLRCWLPRKGSTLTGPTRVASTPRPPLGSPPSPNSHAVAAALLRHADVLAAQLTANGVQFTPSPEANQLVIDDPFAFLVAVIADMGIKAARAWALPYELRQRLGYLDPVNIAASGAAVAEAVKESPKLHRFVNLIPKWIVDAARIVTDQYAGDAGRLWSDTPTATELRRRLERFPGIAQKKAAMAVEILERDLKVPLRDLTGSDVAFDVHLRRVFLRSGIAQHDDVGEMVTAAQALYPERPGALDLPAWDIGRRWCHPRNPDCALCPLQVACPRLIERGSAVSGV
jgi:uncharacterized HhH-GPD family protein